MKQCDLILLSWNHIELTKGCVDSVFKKTHIPSRLIIIDNGSDKPTRDYLSTIKGNETIDIEVLYNETNEGFVRGMNKGLRYSNAPFVCLLNNDIVVADNWLNEMIDVANSFEDIGIVNPDSNTFGSGSKSLEDIDGFVRKKAVRKGFVELGTCVGFCMLIKREVIEKIGYFSEDIDRFYYEDTDYCLTAKRAGYRCVLAKGAYVFHFMESSKTKECNRIGRKNQVYFERKWGRSLRIFFASKYSLDSDEVFFKQDLEKAVGLVDTNNFVYFYYRDRTRISKSELFNRFNIIEHGNVYTIPFSRWRVFFNLYCLYRIIKRWEKRYDIILLKKTFHPILMYLKFIHKADIFDVYYKLDKDYLQGKRFRDKT